MGRLFADLGLVVQGRYALAFSEGALDQSRRYSLASVEGAYFLTPNIRLLAMTAARIGHTGINLAPDSGRVLPAEVFRHHDQISRESYLNIGGGAAVSVTHTWDLFGSFTTTMTGRNTHAVNRGISLGVGLELWRSRRPDTRVEGWARGQACQMPLSEGGGLESSLSQRCSVRL